jgi:predicted transcriptional regulator
VARSVHVPLSAPPGSPHQRESPLTILRTTVREKGITGLYSGCSALVVGNAVKAGVRFVSYDHFKSILADSEVGISLSACRLLTPHRAKSARRKASLVSRAHPSVHVTHRAVSWPGCRDDGGHHRCHPVRNDQVRVRVPFFLPANAHALEQNSSTMPSVRIRNTAVSYTAPRPSYAKKVLRAYTEVYSPSYVHCVYLYPARPASRLDDATRCQFGCALHDVYHPQAVCAVHRTPGTTASDRDYVWYRCHCRSRDGICHATPRVRLVSFPPFNV